MAFKQGRAPADDDLVVGIVDVGSSFTGATRGYVLGVQTVTELRERFVNDKR